MVVQRITRGQRNHAGKKLVYYYNARYCKQGLKLQDNRIYSDDTDAAFVGDRITIEQKKSKQLLLKFSQMDELNVR